MNRHVQALRRRFLPALLSAVVAASSMLTVAVPTSALARTAAPGKATLAPQRGRISKDLLDEVKWDMINEWAQTRRAPKHAAWMHEKAFTA